MRSVALSPLIEKQISPGSQSSGRLSVLPNPAFGAIWLLQRINQPVHSLSLHNGEPFSGLPSQQVNLSQQAAKNGRALLSPPRFTSDTRLLTLSSNDVHTSTSTEKECILQPNQQDAPLQIKRQLYTRMERQYRYGASTRRRSLLSLAIARAESWYQQCNRKRSAFESARSVPPVLWVSFSCKKLRAKNNCAPLLPAKHITLQSKPKHSAWGRLSQRNGGNLCGKIRRCVTDFLRLQR
jgi:hypothetical protein